MSNEWEISKWLEDTAWDKEYWADIKSLAQTLKSDGCTGVPDWMVWTCWEHDIHYRTHRTIDGDYLTRKDADYILRVRIQQSSGFKIFSPISWWRWAGVRVLARKAWHKNDRNN